MRREVLFEAAKRVAEIDDATLSYATLIKADKEKQEEWKVKALATRKVALGKIENDRLTRWQRVIDV